MASLILTCLPLCAGELLWRASACLSLARTQFIARKQQCGSWNHRGAEFAGQENEGQRNFRGWKMQDWKMTDKSAGLENA